MTVMEYMDKFTELAHFADDYVATNMAKVRRFENGLKLSIRGKIMGLLLQDMDSMVRTTMAIEMEIKGARSIQDVGAGGKRKESQSSYSSGKKPKASSLRGFQSRDHQGQGQARAPRGGITPRGRDPRVSRQCSPSHQWDMHGHNLFLHPQYGSEEPISVPGCCTSTSYGIDKPERPGHGLRPRIGPTGRAIRDSGACLRHQVTD